VTNASIALSTLGDSALSIPIEKRDTIYSSDSLSQPNSRSVGIGTALLLLCAHSIHPPSLLLFLDRSCLIANGSLPLRCRWYLDTFNPLGFCSISRIPKSGRSEMVKVHSLDFTIYASPQPVRPIALFLLPSFLSSDIDLGFLDKAM
jgi:hypothetical protein